MARIKSFLYPHRCATGYYESLKSDSNHCALLAFSYLTDIPFAQTQEIFKAKGREVNQPTDTSITHKIMLEAGMQYMGLFGQGKLKDNFAYWCLRHKPIDERYNADHKGMTLKTFCETYNKGKYAVYIKGHMTIVHDGKIIDGFVQRGNTAVISAYKKPE